MRDRKLEPEKDAATLRAAYDKLNIDGITREPLTVGEMTLIFSLGKAISEGWVKDASEPSGRMGMIEENVAHKLARVMGDIAVKNGDMTPEEADDYAENFIQD